MTDDTFDQKTIDALLENHGVDSIDELPAPVRNNVRAGSEADIDPFDFLRDRGGE